MFSKHFIFSYVHTGKEQGKNVYSGLLLCFCLLILSVPAWAKNDLLHEAQYEGEYKNINILMVRKLWKTADNEFLLETKAKNFMGSIVESESFYWSKETGIKPIQYRYKQKVFGIKRERGVKFDWNNNTAKSFDRDDEASHTLEEGILGPLTYQLQIQLDLLKQKSVKQGETYEYNFIDRNKLKNYVFAAQNSINTKNVSEANHVLELKRVNESKNKTTNLFLNAKDHFTMLKLEQIKKDKSHSLNFVKGNYYFPLAESPYASLAASDSEIRN